MLRLAAQVGLVRPTVGPWWAKWLDLSIRIANDILRPAISKPSRDHEKDYISIILILFLV